MQALSDFNVNTQIERAVCLPWGLEGGLEGSGNEMLLRRDGVIDDDVPNAKVFRANVKAGDAYILRSGGGGGFGSRRWSGRPERCSTTSGRAMSRSMLRGTITASCSIPTRLRSMMKRRRVNAPNWLRFIAIGSPSARKPPRRDRTQAARPDGARPSCDQVSAAVVLRALAYAARVRGCGDLTVGHPGWPAVCNQEQAVKRHVNQGREQVFAADTRAESAGDDRR